MTNPLSHHSRLLRFFQSRYITLDQKRPAIEQVSGRASHLHACALPIGGLLQEVGALQFCLRVRLTLYFFSNTGRELSTFVAFRMHLPPEFRPFLRNLRELPVGCGGSCTNKHLLSYIFHLVECLKVCLAVYELRRA